MRINPYLSSLNDKLSVEFGTMNSIPNGSTIYLVHPLYGIREVRFIAPIKYHSIYKEYFFNAWTKSAQEIIPVYCYQYGMTQIRNSLGRVFLNEEDAKAFYEEISISRKIKTQVIRFIKEESKL